MNAVGIFAGRGDVVLAMGAACVLGVIIGWQMHRFKVWVTTRKQEKKQK